MQNFVRNARLPHIVLRPADLQGLWELLLEAIPQEERRNQCSIVTYLPTVDIRAESMEEFLTDSHLPDLVTEMRIEVMGFEGTSVNRDVTVRLTPTYGSVEVRGWDEVWVIGTKQRLEEFLGRKINPGIRKVLTLWIIYTVSVVMIISSGVLSMFQGRWGLGCAIMLMGLMLSYLPAFRPKDLPHTLIILRESSHRPFPTEVVPWIISAVAALATLANALWNIFGPNN